MQATSKQFPSNTLQPVSKAAWNNSIADRIQREAVHAKKEARRRKPLYNSQGGEMHPFNGDLNAAYNAAHHKSIEVLDMVFVLEIEDAIYVTRHLPIPFRTEWVKALYEKGHLIKGGN